MSNTREGLPQEVLALLSKTQSSTATSKLMRQLSEESTACLDSIIIGAYNQFKYMPSSRKQVSTMLCRQKEAGLCRQEYQTNAAGVKVSAGWVLTKMGASKYL